MLFVLAVLIISASLWYTNILVGKIALDEKEKVRLWADAIQKRASLVKYTEELFERLKAEEKKRVQIWAEATKRLINADNNEDLTFYSEIISGNTNIPVVLTDENKRIISSKNTDFSTDSIQFLEGSIEEEYSVYEPITVNIFQNKKSYLYFKESLIFNDLRNILDDIISSFISDVVNNSVSGPVIITDSSYSNIIAYGNIDYGELNDSSDTEKIIHYMRTGSQFFEIELINYGKSYVFYKDSYILTQLRYFPIFQLILISFFIVISYFLFSISRKAEQNQVWAGMAKETAHQFGTPLSSLLAWVELLKQSNADATIVGEIEKDIQRLDIITDRFSKIGSIPKLENTNLIDSVENVVNYMKLRTSNKINFRIEKPSIQLIVPLNEHLFGWVIENLLKNAAEAITGDGEIFIQITDDEKNVFIDISDSGKGISKRVFKSIFNPGYTSKKRGWGLGLSLSERIIEKYHKGRIYVKQSTLNKGTTFRIILRKR